MDAQDLWTATLVLPSLALGLVAWRAGRARRTRLGLDPRAGALSELARGAVFSVLPFAVLAVTFWATGLADVVRWQALSAEVPVIWIYFLVLFLLEEVVFRGLFMTGLGVVTSQTVALVTVAVLTAGAYVFAEHSGVLPVVGAVVTNLLTGLARWRSGRIWWGLGQRWTWNSLTVTFGFSSAAFSLDDPVAVLRLHGPDWLTGGQFGHEGGVVGIVFQLIMITAVLRYATGRQGPWRVEPAGSQQRDRHD